MKELGEVRKRLKGEDAELYMPFARIMLGQLKQRMKMLNLQQLSWKKVLAGGVVVIVASIFGQDIIDIRTVSAKELINNPKKLVEGEFIREEYRPREEFYYLKGAIATRDFFFAVNSNYTTGLYTEANELYSYKDGELTLLTTFDEIGRGAAYGLAVSEALFMVSYLNRDTQIMTVSFYNKSEPYDLYKTHVFEPPSGFFSSIIGQPVFHKNEFKVILFDNFTTRQFVIFDADGELINRYDYDPEFNIGGNFDSPDLNVSREGELLVFQQDINYTVPSSSEVWMIIKINDDYTLGEITYVPSPPLDFLRPYFVDYGGYFSPTSANGYMEGRFNYGAENTIALSTSYTVVTDDGNTTLQVWTQETLEKWYDFLALYAPDDPHPTLIFAFYENEVEWEDAEFIGYPYADIPLYFTITELDGDGAVINETIVDGGGNYGSTAVYQQKEKLYRKYSVKDGVETPVSVEVFDVDEDEVEIFKYKEL